ncbi:MAG: FkbM family methyltransferase, partial [Deltaproteobacteria bacterium]|nr:FkbM family methyltransferase [Deltaproteobacteria bacterium]
MKNLIKRMLYFTEVEGVASKAKVFLYENLYTAFFLLRKTGLLDRNRTFYYPFGDRALKNRLGRFAFRNGTYDYAMLASYYEDRLLDILRDYAGGQIRAGKRILFLDIGAHLGKNCIALKNMFPDCEGFDCVAVEASPQTFSLLQKNISLNNLGKKIKSVNRAVYSSTGEKLQFRFDSRNPGGSSIDAAETSPDPEFIESVTMDDMLDSLSLSPADYGAIIIKMDIEGAEEEALKGAAP